MRAFLNFSIILFQILLSQLLLAQDITNDTTLAKIYFEKASIYHDSTQYDSAIVYFKKASFLYEKQEKWRNYLQSETKRGDCFCELWKLDQAITTIKLAIEKSLQHINENDIIVAKAYDILGFPCYYNSMFDSTIYYWGKALQIRIELLGEKNTSVANYYNNIGIVYDDKNEYDVALQYYFKSLEIRKVLLGEKHTDVAMSYNNIGVVYRKKIETDLAIEYYLKSLQIYKEKLGVNHIDVAMTYNNIGIAYWIKNQSDLALQYHFKSLKIRQELLGEKHTDVSDSYNNIGNVYSYNNEYDLALKYYYKSLQIKRELFGEKNDDVAMTYNNIGVIYDDKSEYDLALEYYLKSLKIRKDLFGEKHIDVATSYNNIGLVYERRAEFNLALKYYQKGVAASLRNFNDTINIYSVPFIKDYLNWSDLLDAMKLKAMIFANYSKNGSDLENALRHYQACDTLINKVRKEITTKSDKIALGEIASELYEGAIDVCKKLIESEEIDNKSYYKELAFYFSEKNKSSVLLEALAGVEAQKFAGIPDSLLKKEYNLQIDIAHYNKILSEQPDSVQEVSFRDKLFTANREYDDLIRTFEIDFPDYFELKYNQRPASVEDIQNFLDDKTAMISYFVGDSMITVFNITKNELDITSVPNIENLADTIKYYRYGLIYTSSDRFAKKYKHFAYIFYKQFIPDNINDEIKNLIIIPDAELSMIPFETFFTKEADDKNWNELPYLIKKFNISYSYSANLFYKTFPKEPSHKIEKSNLNDWLAFAPVFDDSNTAGLTLRTRELLRQFDTQINDSIGIRGSFADRGYITPLPGSESEVQSIFKEFDEKGKKALVQIKKNANEEFIKSGELKNYKYLHFATHGFVNTDKPELSGIFLAQDSTLDEDGILYQGEIYNLELNADLTVLSACETGLGKIKKGEGLIGLTRALLYAGSRNIIVSLWSVADESTSELMIDFYKNLLEGNQLLSEFSKPLQKAKLKMIEEGKYAHPFYWSPFILIGK